MANYERHRPESTVLYQLVAIPLYMGGVKARGTLHYSENVGNADKSLGGAIDALNVRRGWFSVALQFGLGAMF